jgi:hypothetical protein
MYPTWNLRTSAVDVAADWSTSDSYPIKIACVPALCTETENFAYRHEYVDLGWQQFDLVLISDVEMHTQLSIKNWADSLGIKRYLIAVGGIHDHEKISDNTVYRPWWCYNLMRNNQLQIINPGRQFKFDALLGSRRPHRDYVALYLQNNFSDNLLTYRDFFQSPIIDELSDRVAKQFSQPLIFPYVSPELNPAWEVSEQLDYSISSAVPWEIYKRTSYSIVCESLHTGGCFFMSEKTTKAMYARRVFVVLSAKNFYKNLHLLGFKTFGHIIDESWDSENDDLQRYRLACNSIAQLNKLDTNWVYEQAAEVIEHNQQHLETLQRQTQRQMRLLINREVSSVLEAKKQ